MTDLEISYSIRAQILQKIGERAQQMIVLLPSGMDADAQLFWARQQLHPSELPAVNILPQPETGDRSYGADHLTMPVQISIACLLGNNSAVDLAEDLLATMRRTVPGSDPTLGGLAQDIRYMSGGVDDYPEDADQALVATTLWEIDYQTQANNPDEQ